ncbi:MAG: hypothetical protein H6852_02850 [Geminicoccaceae bacterium]|nr:hypothetical protein [Geminicoccaceae bacterium]MCB9966562.1 hypothetical protein [Geminicoccaceae bacterium]
MALGHGAAASPGADSTAFGDRFHRGPGVGG